jgi:ribosomal protein L11 methyltransferase
MRWLQVRFEVTRDAVNLLETLLETLGAVSVILDDAADQPLLEPLPGETPIWDQVIVTGLFEEDADPVMIENFVKAQAPTVRAFHDYLEQQVWERAWMDHYEPIACGERLWIVPEWLEPPEPNAVNLMLDPGLAFGTGNHASTFLCMQWLDGEDLNGKIVIDFGCGSGILGIAALLLGAKQVYSTDIDPQAILATRQNAEINGVADRLWVGLPEAFDEQLPDLQADVIVANILAAPLAALAPEFARRAHAGTRIALAGLISEQVDGLKDRYAPWFDLNELATREENWCRLSGARHRH